MAAVLQEQNSWISVETIEMAKSKIFVIRPFEENLLISALYHSN